MPRALSKKGPEIRQQTQNVEQTGSENHERRPQGFPRVTPATLDQLTGPRPDTLSIRVITCASTNVASLEGHGGHFMWVWSLALCHPLHRPFLGELGLNKNSVGATPSHCKISRQWPSSEGVALWHPARLGCTKRVVHHAPFVRDSDRLRGAVSLETSDRTLRARRVALAAPQRESWSSTIPLRYSFLMSALVPLVFSSTVLPLLGEKR